MSRSKLVKIGWSFAIGIAMAIATPVVASALGANERDPRVILRAVHKESVGDRGITRVKMVVRDDSGSRERTLQIRFKEFEGGRKTLIFFESPSDVRNTALLSVDYDDRARPDEQWLYLPTLRRTTRISGSGRSGSFMGSDFTYADLGKADPDDYELTLVEASTQVDGEDCWLIEATPRNATVQQETGYSKSHLWVSKGKLRILQVKNWMAGGKIKYVKASDFRKINGIWTPHRMQARTLRGTKVLSETLLGTVSVKLDDPKVNDADFTPARLEQGF